MFVVCVTSRVLPERVEDYIAACEANASATRREPGCLRFDLLRCVDPDTQFFFYEAYLSEEDFHAHHRTEHYLKWRETVAPWMDGPREGVRYHSVSPVEAGDWRTR